jgi:protein dithiol oxidoreductase (disulfide-forming)
MASMLQWFGYQNNCVERQFMNSFRRLFALLFVSLFILAACKPSADKTAASTSAETSLPATLAPTDANNPPLVNSQQVLGNGEYSVLAMPQPAEKGGKVEVLEFFGYYCSHCKSFDPALTEWSRKNAGKVIFKRVPIAFRDNMIPQQRLYYALEAMGKLDGLHQKIFDEVQLEKRSFSKDEEIFDFVARNGIDRAKFKELYESFTIQSQAKNASNLQAAYKIESVPNLAVDGRYMTSVSHALKRPGAVQTEAGLQAATLQIVDELVNKVLKERGASSKSGK